MHRADSSSGIHPDELTIAELFQQNGYATACIGKWHLGFQKPFLPRNQGFDHYFGLLHNLNPVEFVYFGDKGVPLMRNDKIVKRPADPAELTKLYTDEAIDFMEKNAKKPIFLYLPHTMLHHPVGVSEEFQGTSKWGEYGDAIQELDHNFGRLFDSLKRLDIHDNTISSSTLRITAEALVVRQNRRFVDASSRRTKVVFAYRRSHGDRDLGCRRARRRRWSTQWTGIRRSRHWPESRFPKVPSSTVATSVLC